MDWGSGAFITIANYLGRWRYRRRRHDRSLRGLPHDTGGLRVSGLAREYQRLYRRYAVVYDGYDCGVTLAEHINVELSTLARRMREIEAEVAAITTEEHFVSTDPGVDWPEVV